MRRLVCAVFSAAIVLQISFAIQAQEAGAIIEKSGVQEEYDKFKDKTFVSIGPEHVKLSGTSAAKRAWLTAMFSYPGRKLESKPLGFTIGLFVIAGDRVFPKYSQRLIVLADSRRVFDDEMTLVSTWLRPEGVIQGLTVFFPPSVFRELATAELVEAQLESIEFQLTDENIRDCGELDLRSNPSSASAYYDRGVARYKKKDLDGAIADFTKAIELNPGNPNTYFNRGLALDDKQDYDGAVADYTKAIELNPRFDGAYNNRGVARDKKRDLDGAIADYTKAIALNPSDAFFYANRGFTLLNKGKDQEAEQDFKRAIELNATLKPEIEERVNDIKQARKAMPKP